MQMILLESFNTQMGMRILNHNFEKPRDGDEWKNGDDDDEGDDT
jgi:hypothetical protein